jgi:hypothetical protein
MGKWVSRVCFFCLVCSVGLATAAQPDNPGEPIGWEVLPNGLIEVHYDRTGDGVPDVVTLHQVTWSGWTAQAIPEIEAQAAADGLWIFIVEYDQDRYVYMAGAEPLTCPVCQP